MWSPVGQTQWLYARQPGSSGELVVGDAQGSHTLVNFDGGIAFGWSPDGQHIAYALNTPDSFLYQGLRVFDLADSSSQAYFNGNVLAFFWSPDATSWRIHRRARRAIPVGRAGGLGCAPPFSTAHVASDLACDRSRRPHDRSQHLEPTDAFIYLIQY
jgi:hypothetical protein